MNGWKKNGCWAYCQFPFFFVDFYTESITYRFSSHTVVIMDLKSEKVRWKDQKGAGNLMKYTSAEAAKLLRELNDRHDNLELQENLCSVFNAALGENIEDVRPEYDYRLVQDQLADLEQQIRKVKHVISMFNLTHLVPGFDMTVDQILVYIPQLSKRKQKLAAMMQRLPKQRASARGFSPDTTVIDYCIANYDPEKAKEDYTAVSAELSRAQTALDLLNSTETMEIEL